MGSSFNLHFVCSKDLLIPVLEESVTRTEQWRLCVIYSKSLQCTKESIFPSLFMVQTPGSVCELSVTRRHCSCRTSRRAWTTWTTCSKWNQRTRPPWSCCRTCRRRSDDTSGTLETAVRICHCAALQKEEEDEESLTSSRAATRFDRFKVRGRERAFPKSFPSYRTRVLIPSTVAGTNASSATRRFWETQLRTEEERMFVSHQF